MLQDATRLQGTPDQLVGTTFRDIQVSAMKAPDCRGYYVMLEGLEETEDKTDLLVKPRYDLLQQVVEQYPDIEQAVTGGSASIPVQTVADAARVVGTVLTVIPFVDEIHIPDGYVDPNIELTRPFKYHVKCFPIGQRSTSKEHAQALFRARRFVFPPENGQGEEQQFDETVRGLYQTKHRLTVSFYAHPPTETGITMRVQTAQSTQSVPWKAPANDNTRSNLREEQPSTGETNSQITTINVLLEPLESSLAPLLALFREQGCSLVLLRAIDAPERDKLSSAFHFSHPILCTFIDLISVC